MLAAKAWTGSPLPWAEGGVTRGGKEKPGKQPAIPEDLREWLGETELADLVREVTLTLPNGGAEQKVPAHWESMLRVVILQYAKGRYASQEAAVAMITDGEVAETCASRGMYEPTNCVRCFRRQYRPAIEQCLTDLLACAWESFHGEHPPSLPEFRREAERRLDQAMQLDSWNADE